MERKPHPFLCAKLPLLCAALRRISAKSVALVQCVCPVMTAVFSYIILAERLSIVGIFGAALILLCVSAEILLIDP